MLSTFYIKFELYLLPLEQKRPALHNNVVDNFNIKSAACVNFIICN